MAINTSKSTQSANLRKGAQTETPKSVRLKQSDLDNLDTLKERIAELTNRNKVSDTVAFRAALEAAQKLSDSALQRIVGNI